MISKPKVEICFTPNLFPLYAEGFDVVVAIDVKFEKSKENLLVHDFEITYIQGCDEQ